MSAIPPPPAAPPQQCSLCLAERALPVELPLCRTCLQDLDALSPKSRFELLIGLRNALAMTRLASLLEQAAEAPNISWLRPGEN